MYEFSGSSCDVLLHHIYVSSLAEARGLDGKVYVVCRCSHVPFLSANVFPSMLAINFKAHFPFCSLHTMELGVSVIVNTIHFVFDILFRPS